ncbi:NAD(P)-dependent oxidoreductase [Candidatus Gracilibacteria bacterium]|nr:NAD(P)-dependent oxidoreductase [Candidatus Gracilibacteria bacterium]
MRIAVTGGNGDLGRTLVPFWLESGHEVVSIDRALPPPPQERPQHMAHHLVGDTRDFGQVVGCLSGCDAVVHLAAHRSPRHAPEFQVYVENTAGSYHVLSAAAALGIRKVCLASSINAIGGAFSHAPRYDYFPLDEQHPTYAEDSYSLSKWVLEQQADAIVRTNPQMTVASLRFHGLVHDTSRIREWNDRLGAGAVRHLWGYTAMHAAARACLLSLLAEYHGHEVFYIVAPQHAATEDSRVLAQQYYPQATLHAGFAGLQGFFDCSKAARLLAWEHEGGKSPLSSRTRSGLATVISSWSR